MLDQHSLTLAQLPGVSSARLPPQSMQPSVQQQQQQLEASVLQKIQAYLRWLPMNPDLNSLGRLLVNQVGAILSHASSMQLIFTHTYMHRARQASSAA